MTETEWLYGRMMSADRDDAGFATDQLPFYRRSGLDEASVQALAERGNTYAPRVSPVPRSFRRIGDGTEITIGARRWRVVIGRGHAPEHACLHCPELGIFIAGDQVLPKISPNVSLWPNEPEDNPLAHYLASLAMLRRAIPADVLVLPSHNLPFYGLETRIDQLCAHHAERLAAVEATCAEPRSAAEILPFLFRRALDTHQLGFAIGEALAHLHYLCAEGHLVRRARTDGVDVFTRIGLRLLDD
jgi:glyoxylase-like metal-dependent hydrolase (beta-lactamase superfamily II)